MGIGGSTLRAVRWGWYRMKRGYSDFVVKRRSNVAEKKEGGVQVGFEERSWKAAVEEGADKRTVEWKHL